MNKKALGVPNVIGFEIFDLKKILSLFFLFILFVIKTTAQNNTIRGKVVDSSGRALQAVSVTVKGIKVGTTTNNAGEFQLNAVPSRAVIVVSSVGFATQEVRLAP